LNEPKNGITAAPKNAPGKSERKALRLTVFFCKLLKLKDTAVWAEEGCLVEKSGGEQ